MNNFSREDIMAFVAIGIVIIVTLLIIAVAISGIYAIPSPSEVWEQSTNLQADWARLTKKK